MYVFGMGAALGWPLSFPNLDFAARMGCFWGCVGSVLVSGFSLNCSEAIRLKVALIGALVWAVVSGMYFSCWVVAVASC